MLKEELHLLMASIRTTEGMLFLSVLLFSVLHCLYPSDDVLVRAVDGFTGALLMSLKASLPKTS